MVQNRNAIPWDLLETFLVLSEARTIRGAAEKLQINHATVSRQLKKLEQLLGQPLFERSNQGLSMTVLGEAMLNRVAPMAEQSRQLQFFLDHQSDDIAGTLNISLGDGLMQAVIPAFKLLRQQQPGLTINFNVSNDLVSLDKGEADIALRITSTPPEHLVAVPLQQISAAAFVSPVLLKEQGLPLNGELNELTDKLDWISWRRNAGDIDIAEAIRDIIGEENIKYSMDSGTALMEALQGGLGAGFMMTSSVAREHDLVEIEGSRQELPLKFWLLYHPNSRPSPKIRAAVDCMREVFGV